MNDRIVLLDYRLPDTHQFFSLEKLGDFYSHCFKTEYSDFLNAEDMGSVSAWNGRSLAEDMISIDNSDTVTTAIFEDSTLLGTAIFAERYGYVYIWGMYVHPDRLRSGIGTALIKNIVQSVSPESKLQVSVITKSARAISFYKSLGFKLYKTELCEVFPNVELVLDVMQCPAQAIG